MTARFEAVPSAGQAASSSAAFEAAFSGFADIVPKLESELGGIEIAIRDVTHIDGTTMYKSLPKRVDAALPTPECLECGGLMERHQKHVRYFASRSRPVEVERIHCRCRGCGYGFFPSARALGLEGQTATSDAASIAADAVTADSCEEASRKLLSLVGVSVPPTTLRHQLRSLGEEARRFEREAVEERTPGTDRVC